MQRLVLALFLSVPTSTAMLLNSNAVLGQEAASSSSRRAPDYPPTMDGAHVEVYKTVDGTELNAYIFEPNEQHSRDGRPAIVFFFGGGWRGGSPTQFEQHCKYFQIAAWLR